MGLLDPSLDEGLEGPMDKGELPVSQQNPMRIRAVVDKSAQTEPDNAVVIVGTESRAASAGGHALTGVVSRAALSE